MVLSPARFTECTLRILVDTKRKFCMLRTEVIESLKKHFDVHPLVFHRSLEKAITQGDLFDILDTIPEQCPIIWDDSQHKWVSTDLLQAKEFENKANICFQ